MVALPVQQLEDALRALGAHGTHTCVILTSGLGETSAEGRRRPSDGSLTSPATTACGSWDPTASAS